MIIATAGHVDHGKTALVRALTGVETDRLPEEKDRGLTIDLGFAPLRFSDGRVASLVDVPGHERFIRTMIAGVAGIGAALLVVAADDGIMPQTLEHIEVLHLLGVSRGCVALTKIDRVGRDRVEEVGAALAALLATTSLRAAPILAVSSVTGAGVPELLRALDEATPVASERTEGRFRVSVDRAFSLTGIGLVATGIVRSGRAGTGDEVMLSPLGRTARIRGIQTNGRTVHAAEPGTRCALNLKGDSLAKNAFHRGAWLLDPALHAPTHALDVEIDTMLPAWARSAKRDRPVHLHLGAEDVTGRLSVLGRPDADAAAVTAHIALDRPIGALFGDRFVLRDTSGRANLAGGRVLDPFSPAKGWARSERLDVLRALRTDDPGAALAGLAALQPVALEAFFRARNLPTEHGGRLLAAVPLVHLGRGERAAVVSPDLWAGAGDSLLGTIADFHLAHPDRGGIGAVDLGRAARTRVLDEVFEPIVSALVHEGRILRSGPVLSLPDHRPRLTEGDERRWRQVRPLLDAVDLRPPRTREIAEALGWELDAVERFLERAEELGLAHQVAANRYFLPGTLRRLGDIASELADDAADGRFSASEYKDRSGIGRNLTIRLLEFFDRAGLTRRAGDGREMREDARSMFSETAREDAG